MYRLMPLLLLLMLVTGCSSGGDETETKPLNLYGVTLNGSTVNGDPTDIPLNTTLEFRFSAAIDQAKFENALSITDNTGAVPYSASYSNASSVAVITLGDLQEMTEHTVQLMSGAFGAKGEQFSNGKTFTFTTDAGQGYTACTTGTAECMRTYTMNMDGTDYTFSYYSNYDLESDPEFVWNNIEHLVVVVHGQNRNADDYFRIMNQTLAGTSLQGNTLVIAPYFKDNASASGNDLYWGSAWRFGADAGNVGTTVSSFDVVDAMIKDFTTTSQFPDMKTVFVTGHSSGASFSHYYSVSSDITEQVGAVNVEYSVLNSQYFFYPTNQRYNEDNSTWYTPTSCAGFDAWPYGYEFAPRYLDGVDKNTMVLRLGAMNTVLFHGANDDSQGGTLNTSDCQAVLLGSNRVERGRNYNNYLNTYIQGNNTDFTIVPNAAHDAATMYGSDEFKDYLEARKAN